MEVKHMKLSGLATSLAATTTAIIGIACATLLLETSTALAADSAPPVGSYYSSQHTDWPPLPENFLNLPTTEIGDNVFLLDDMTVNYVELNEQAELLSQAERAVGLTSLDSLS